MDLTFTKMHGLGNDFVVIDAINQDISLSRAQMRFLANRRLGVGCDQILLVEAARQADTDFHYRIFNADGSEVEQCGNGARCFARFIADKGLSGEGHLRVSTTAGIIELSLNNDGQVTVNMGAPDFHPESLPFSVDAESLRYKLDIEDQSVEFGVVSMGNPHMVIAVKSVLGAPVIELGAKLESHPAFPNRVNVGFMQIVDRAHIRLRVFERGVGETQACGTGACAAMAVARQQGLVDDMVEVELPGGLLNIGWHGNAAPVYMTGPAVSVFEGRITL